MRKLCILMAVTLAMATLPVIANAGIISKDDLAGSIIFTYDGSGFDSSNVINVEVTNSAFTSVGPLSALARPDFYNYGFNLNITGLSLASRPGESHPQALPEPYVNLSAHTAPDVLPFP